MGKKSDVGWLVEPGVREVPRKAIEEARELLEQGKEYARHVVEAWLKRKTVKWNGYHFRPKAFGVEVYEDGEYEASWKNRAIEIVFYKLALEEQVATKAGTTATKKASDEDQVDVDVVVNVEAPKQAKDIEGKAEVEEIGEDMVEAEDTDLEEEPEE